MSVSVCMHACIPLSSDWLNDFLKGCRATISFWHLITVRSHRAPADPLWYGPCTCWSPLSQVPIIIIKTPSPPPWPPNHTHTCAPRLQATNSSLRARGGFAAARLIKRSTQSFFKIQFWTRDLCPLQCSCTEASLQWELKVAVNKETAFPFPLCPDTLPKLAWRVTWQTLAIWKKGQESKVRPVSGLYLATDWLWPFLRWITNFIAPLDGLVSVKPMTAGQKSNLTPDQIRASRRQRQRRRKWNLPTSWLQHFFCLFCIFFYCWDKSEKINCKMINLASEKSLINR